MVYKLTLTLLTFLLIAPVVSAQETVAASVEATVGDPPMIDSSLIPAPPSDIKAVDTDNDHGHSITVTWELSADDGSGMNNVLSYEVFRWVPFLMDELDTLRVELARVAAEIDSVGRLTGELKDERAVIWAAIDDMADQMPEAHRMYPEGGEWRLLGKVASGVATYDDTGGKDRKVSDFIPDFSDLYFRVEAVTSDSAIRAASGVAGPVQSYGQWFNTGRTPVFIAFMFFGIMTVFFVIKARRGAELYVRPLAGIEAVDDAIGRATEMGRPILYVLGLGTAADVATIASFTILGRVAKRVAEYQTELIVPTYDPIVMSVAQEVVKSSFSDAGRPEDYNEDIVYFVTQLQFAYVAAVNGTMLRELPATNVYMGKFFAESLLLAETGALAGSIQIAGTDEIAQIPFFIVACDFTLIGEELYAASAYLGREPVLLGSLKAQDYAKAAMILLAIVGVVAAQFEWNWFIELFHVVD